MSDVSMLLEQRSPERSSEFAASVHDAQRRAKAVSDALDRVITGNDLMAEGARFAQSRYPSLGLYVSNALKLGLGNAAAVVDLGSGVGQWCVAACLAGARNATGVELRKEFTYVAGVVAASLDLADRTRFVARDCCETGLDSDAYDFTVCHGVMQFLNHEAAMREANRLLKHGGLFYCGYTGAGARYRGAHQAFLHDEPGMAEDRLTTIVNTSLYELGVVSQRGNQVRAFDVGALQTLARIYGFDVLSEPDLQDGPRAFLGMPSTFDFLARKRSSYDEVLEAYRLECGQSRARALERVRALIRMGAPGAALDLMPRLGLEDQRSLFIHASIKAGRGAELGAAQDAVDDPFVAAVLACERWRFADALQALEPILHENADARFLKAYCLLADGRPADAASGFRQNWNQDRLLRDLSGRVVSLSKAGRHAQAADELVEGLHQHVNGAPTCPPSVLRWALMSA